MPNYTNRIRDLIGKIDDVVQHCPETSPVGIGSDPVNNTTVNPKDFLLILQYARIGMQARGFVSVLSNMPEEMELVNKTNSCSVCDKSFGPAGFQHCGKCERNSCFSCVGANPHKCGEQEAKSQRSE